MLYSPRLAKSWIVQTTDLTPKHVHKYKIKNNWVNQQENIKYVSTIEMLLHQYSGEFFLVFETKTKITYISYHKLTGTVYNTMAKENSCNPSCGTLSKAMLMGQKQI